MSYAYYSLVPSFSSLKKRFFCPNSNAIQLAHNMLKLYYNNKNKPDKSQQYGKNVPTPKFLTSRGLSVSVL